jgi:hypothetical protein
VLIVAALLCFGVGLVHSVLGERYILIRLFRGSRIPVLFGSDLFTRRTLRFAWHLTTIAWWGFGYLLQSLSRESAEYPPTVLQVVGVVFFVSGAVALVASRGRHLSWMVFWTIAVLCALSL